MSREKAIHTNVARCCHQWQSCAQWFSDSRRRKGMRVMDTNTADSEVSTRDGRNGLSRTLDAAGWGLFFIWVGFSLLLDLGWGVGLIGVAAIILLKQLARKYFGRKIEKFWMAIGVLFFLGGIWELYHIEVGLVPVLMIVAGGALLLSLIRRRR